MLILILTSLFVLVPLVIVALYHWADRDPSPDLSAVLIVFILVGFIALFIEFGLFGRRTDDRRAIRDHDKYGGIIELVDSAEDKHVSFALRQMLAEEIRSINAAIKSAKEMNNGTFDWWIVDELAELEPLE